jgi:hypothetical protein
MDLKCKMEKQKELIEMELAADSDVHRRKIVLAE